MAAQDLLTVPVVVHVVYNNENQNLSDDIIYSQINALNRDFRKQNDDLLKVDNRFTNLIADANIQFKLTNLDPNNQESSGITRTKTTHGVFGNSDIHFTSKGGIDAWDPTKYLNIWVADLSPSFLGWSGNPSTINAQDGVVIDFAVFGVNNQTEYNLGRTTVHEVGHWLGLAHPEGVGSCQEDDGIEDTPLQESSYFSCQKEAQSCGSYDMTQNFMQSNVDSCLLFFTKGQAVKMRSVLLKERKILSENAHSLVGFQDEHTPKNLSVLNTKEGLRIQNLSRPIAIYIYNIDGQLSFQKNQTIEPFIETNDFKTGVYMLQLVSENELITQKIYINH